LVLSCTVSEIWQVLCATYPTPIQPQFWGCSRCIRSLMLGVSQHMTLSYLAVKLFSKNSNVFEHGTWSLRTDGQTDGRLTVASPRSALASRGKNLWATFGSFSKLHQTHLYGCGHELFWWGDLAPLACFAPGKAAPICPFGGYCSDRIYIISWSDRSLSFWGWLHYCHLLLWLQLLFLWFVFSDMSVIFRSVIFHVSYFQRENG